MEITETQLADILNAGRQIAFDTVWFADPKLAGPGETPDLYLIVRVGEGRTVSQQTVPAFLDDVRRIVHSASVVVEGWDDLVQNRLPEAEAVRESMQEISVSCSFQKSPHEIIRQAALHGVPRPELIRELQAFPYTFGEDTAHPHDGRIPGTWDQVVAAYVQGLISDEEFAEVRKAVS